MKYESELRELLSIPTGVCCDSCHDDYDQGYGMMELEWNGETYECCCGVYRAAKVILDMLADEEALKSL